MIYRPKHDDERVLAARDAQGRALVVDGWQERRLKLKVMGGHWYASTGQGHQPIMVRWHGDRVILFLEE